LFLDVELIDIALGYSDRPISAMRLGMTPRQTSRSGCWGGLAVDDETTTPPIW